MRKVTFVTGPAGTGKSFKLVAELEMETRPHLIVAPTGIAAVNVGGATMHRTFKIHSESGFVGKRWPDVEVVYVDECSMMGASLFEAAMIGAPNAEFILYGDMAQLPPVKDKYWFETKEPIELNTIKLTKQYRQENDLTFALALNAIRMGDVQRKELSWVYKNSTIDDIDSAITLALRNDTVRAINAERLLTIDSELFEFQAEYGGAMKPTDCIAEQNLSLKKGARIIMLKNDKEGRWSNGTVGEVFNIASDSLWVKIGGSIYMVGKHEWQMKTPQEITPIRRLEIENDLENGKFIRQEEIDLYRHFLNTGIEYVVIGRCHQYPVKLAYALTVHKSQGMTLDRAHIVTSGFSGMHGIGYVALSRVRSVDTLSFDRKPVPGDFKFDQRLAQYI
jgi:ATP-dependent DNA helicase PIF1